MINTTDAKKVIILGAGASAADGAPLQAGLFRKYAEIIQRPKSITPSSEGELRTFFDYLWGVDIDSTNLATAHFPTFEEVLGLLEMANARGEFFKGFGGLHTEATRAQEMRAHLVQLIALVLDEALTHTKDTHTSLITNMKKLGWMDKASFLSFNYDLLVDNSLHASLGGDPDYAVSFRSGSSPTGSSHPVLLKLHGSLNWLFCPTCNQLDYYPLQKIVATIVREPWQMTCDTCKEPRVPILIPPTFFKVMSNFYLQQIWHNAEKTLRDANHLIFCGYSFPDADIHFKYLLKRAEINQPEHSSNYLEVFIINEHPGKSVQQRNDEKDRYLRFFRNKGLVHWTKLSFRDFADNPSAYADPNNWK
ncbi:MAG: SIR2 family protein [Verrucomicrobiota bacterium]|nr:SIR2 family protein [Verrucomicrobiota bacterium]